MRGYERAQPLIDSDLAKAKEDSADNGKRVRFRLVQQADNQHRSKPGQLPGKRNATLRTFPVRASGHATACGSSAGQPVDHNGQQHNHNAGGQRLSETR